MMRLKLFSLLYSHDAKMRWVFWDEYTPKDPCVKAWSLWWRYKEVLWTFKSWGLSTIHNSQPVETAKMPYN
jgi:hypothetical protein